jgi:class 3 adenylate cyclase
MAESATPPPAGVVGEVTVSSGDGPAVPGTPIPSRSGGPVRVGVWVLHLALPLLALWLLMAQPELDARWQHQPSHFWLVLGVAAVSTWLGLRVWRAAREHRDARLLLVAAAFVAGAGFLFLHALATPGVLLEGSNAGFAFATPVGLTIASVLVALSALEPAPERAAAIVRHERWLRYGLIGVMVLWAVVSLAELAPLSGAPAEEEMSGAFTVMAIVAVVLYGFAAVRYFTIHRRRPSVMLVGILTAFALLAEAMVAVTVARNWQLSWWTWHILMTAAFLFLAYSAHVQYRREGTTSGLFNSIATERTLARIREDYGSALESLTATFRQAEDRGYDEEELRLITTGLAARFGLSELQTEVLARAARALASERDQGVRLAALAEVGTRAHVQADEQELLQRVVELVSGSFGRDLVRIGLRRGGELVRDPELSRGDWSLPGERISLPLRVRGREAGVLEVLRPGGSFDDRDRALVQTLATEVSIALENTRLYGDVRTLFRRYMSPDVADALLADPGQAALGGAVVEVTAMFADLRGFTSFSERRRPEEIVEMLNRHFGLAVPHILGNGGTVVQFQGDAVLAVFNAPARQPDHPLRAATAALEMQESITELADRHGWPRFRIGINTGPALVGNIGSEELRTYNVMGDAINVAARLEAVAEPGRVVVGGATAAAIGDAARFAPLGPLELKGRSEPVEAFELLAVG